MKALLVVDLQNDFCPDGALATPEGDKIIPVVNKLMKQFPMVLASKDWHPKDTVHFKKWPPHCIKHSKGAAFPEALDHEQVYKLFYKGTDNKDDGYSAFEATEDLAAFLQDKQVTDLYIAGLTTEYCVKQTVLDALKSGFNTYPITDAIEGVKAHPDDERHAYAEMEEKGARLVTSDALNGDYAYSANAS